MPLIRTLQTKNVNKNANCTVTIIVNIQLHLTGFNAHRAHLLNPGAIVCALCIRESAK